VPQCHLDLATVPFRFDSRDKYADLPGDRIEQSLLFSDKQIALFRRGSIGGISTGITVSEPDLTPRLPVNAQRSDDPRACSVSRAFRPTGLKVIESEFRKREFRKATGRCEHRHDSFETVANRFASLREDGSNLIETVKLLDSLREFR